MTEVLSSKVVFNSTKKSKIMLQICSLSFERIILKIKTLYAYSVFHDFISVK